MKARFSALTALILTSVLFATSAQAVTSASQQTKGATKLLSLRSSSAARSKPNLRRGKQTVKHKVGKVKRKPLKKK